MNDSSSLIRQPLTTRKSPKKLQIQRPPKQYTEQEVSATIASAISSGSNVPDTVNSLLNACSAESAEPLRRVIFETCISALNKDSLQTRAAKDITGKLLFEVEKLKGESLVILAELLIKDLKEGYHQALEIFPKLISVISSKRDIIYKKDDGSVATMGGLDQRCHLLNSLCGCRWESSCVQHIVHISLEIPMDSEELKFLVEKIFRVMKSLKKVTELPPLVYELLVLSMKGHRTMILEGIKILFNQLDQEVLDTATEEDTEDSLVTVRSSKAELLQAEGTVILHMTCALKQDSKLRSEFIKSLKASQLRLSAGTLSLFNIALLLSMARIHIFEDTVFSFMKEIVLRSFKEHERREVSKWMQEVNQDAPDLERIILDTVHHSVGGWDHVVEGLFIVGLQLMDNLAPKTSSSIPSGPQYKACCLGSNLLHETFKVHPMVRQEIVSQLINRILINASTYVAHYIGLLSSLVEHYHQSALDSLPKLKEAFSSLSLLPPQPALDLLQAVLPLVGLNMSLRDCLLLVLKKSLFSRMVEARRIAVGGYLMLLKKFKILDSMEIDSQNFSSSQVQVEIHGTSTSSSHSSGNGALCLEILGTLRGAMTKQYDVRKSLYEGICSVFFTNSKLAEPIMELLLGQFEKYYEPEELALPPVKLPSCLLIGDGDVSLLEPLDELLRSMQLCVSKYILWQEKLEERRMEGEEEEEEGREGEIPEVIASAQKILRSLVDRMVKSEPEDFELDKSSDFSPGTSVGKKNRILAKLVMGILETLLEFTFVVGEFSQESIERTVKLFQNYKRISDILQEKGGAQGGGASSGRKGGGASGATQSKLTLQCVLKLLEGLFSDSTPNHQLPLKTLRETNSFPKYVVYVALQKIRQMPERNTCQGPFSDLKPKKLFNLSCLLAKLLFCQVEDGVNSPSGAKKDKGKSVPVLCFDGFSELLHKIISRHHTQCQIVSIEDASTSSMNLGTFLSTICPSIDSSATLDEKIHYFIRCLQRLISRMLDMNVKDWSMREVVLVANIIGALASQLSGDSEELNEVFKWISSQCKEQTNNDIHVTKAYVSLLLTLNGRLKGSVKILAKLAQDVHYHLGDIDQDIELEFTSQYCIVNRHTAPLGVLNLLYSHFDLVLVDADWLITHLKTELVTNPVEEILETERSPICTQANVYCSSLCNRLVIVSNGLSQLSQTLLAAGSYTQGLLKIVTKFFTVLGNLTKFCLASYQYTYSILPSYRKLVDIIGTELSPQIYSFINFIQSEQDQPGGGGGEGRDKKSKKGKGKAGANGGGGGGKAVVHREKQCVPSLIYAIEQFEKFLVQLGKKSKENLVGNFKRAQARDFRINMKAECMVNEEEDQSDDSEKEGLPPPSKRHREA